MNSLRLIAVAGAAAVALAACSQGAQGPPTISSVTPASPNYGTLQFAVGTANIFGTTTGLNVVSTFRQVSAGTPALSAVLVSTPKITGPFTLPALASAGSGYDPFATIASAGGGGPSAQEAAAGATISGTSQSVRFDQYVCDQVAACSNSTPANTTSFGQSGGVFAMGLQPANTTNNGVSASYVPYQEPIWDTSKNAFTDFGGPPAYDPDKNGLGLRDGLNNLGSGVLGVNEGITVFEGVTPRAGTYALDVQVPTGQTNQNAPTFADLTKSAALGSIATLPTVTATIMTPDGAGGGSFVVTLPAGVTEEFIQVIDIGPGTNLTNCQGALGANSGLSVYYTLVAKAGGTATLPPTIGPNTSSGSISSIVPSPSICTATQNTAANGGTATPADQYTVQVIGTDYPLYEASALFGSPAPTIVGSTGQSDITISAPIGPYIYGSESAGPVTSSTLHRPATRFRR